MDSTVSSIGNQIGTVACFVETNSCMIHYKFTNIEKEFLKELGKLYKGNPLNSYSVLRNLVINRCPGVGLYCDLNSSSKSYNLYVLDQNSLRGSESSLSKVIGVIQLLNKILKSDDLICVDKAASEMKSVFFLTDIKQEINQSDTSVFRFTRKSDVKYHQLDRKSKVWSIYQNESYNGIGEEIESITLKNMGSTMISFMLNSTMTISEDLNIYIKNGCLSDEEIYNNKQLCIARFTAIVAVVTMIINGISTYFAWSQSQSAIESVNETIVKSSKNLERVEDFLDRYGTESTSLCDSAMYRNDSLKNDSTCHDVAGRSEARK